MESDSIMSGYPSKEAALQELEKYRGELLDIVNKNIDTLKTRILHDVDGRDDSVANETIYPLCIAPALLKGTKPTAIFFGNEKVTVRTWRAVYSEILRRCADDSDTKNTLMYLRNKISGRKRIILADKSDGMNKPVKLADGLYAETYFDTEWLIRILTTHILNAAHYDYSGICVAAVHKNGRR